MNKKDRNLYRGLAFMASIVALLCWCAFRLAGGDALRALGGLVALYGSLRLCLALRAAYGVAPADPRRYGRWAVVTGCTGGLGQEFARHCAELGLNVAMVSRSRKKLEALAEELEAPPYGVKTAVLVFDFAQSTCKEEEAFYGKTLPEFIAASPIGGDVGLLVNNVGVGDVRRRLARFFTFPPRPGSPPKPFGISGRPCAISSELLSASSIDLPFCCFRSSTHTTSLAPLA